MTVRVLFTALAAAFAKPAFRDAPQSAAIIAPRRRVSFAGALRGAIRSERGLGRGLQLLSGLSRIGRGGGV